MVLKLTIATADGSVAMIQVASDAPMETVAETIAIELSIPVAEQQLRFNGRLIARDGTVAEKGLSDGDLILVSREETAQSASGLSPEQTEILDRIRSNTEIMARLRSTNPQLHDRIVAGDPAALQELITIFNRVHAQQRGATEDPASFDDPMSEDAQRAIMERIRRENVMENMHAAMEHNPESFGSVVMLFVDCKVNGVDGVKAFVDSGAQATIISRECAERCNILRLIDKNFEGMARGVGTAKIHGRIHLSLLTLGTEVFEVSFTVMDAVGGGYDVLLGLDMLRKHQACIDLVSNQLRIGGAAVPFLPEKDIPKRMREHIPPNLTDSESRQAGPSSSAHSGHSGGSSSRISEQSISTLLNLGFSREESIQALEQCEGDADQAASLLAQSKYGF